MKIVINTAHQRFGGGIQVALSFVYECRYFPDHEYYVWVGPGVAKSLKEDDFAPNFHFTYFNFGVINLTTTPRINRRLQIEEQKVQPDVIIATSGPSYFHSNAPQIIGFNLGYYIYPESPYIQGLTLFQSIRLNIKKQIHFHFFKRDASAYFVQTDDVNQRVRRELKTKEVYTVTNTHNGFYNSWKKYPDRLPTKDAEVLRCITISAYYAHKNLEIIPKVLEELRRCGYNKVEFVLTLKEEDFQKHIPPDPNIINVGPVVPEACPSLYNECDVLFLPTLIECFSASYPEAMVMDLPIVTTDLGFARSICGDAALYFEAQDPISAADAIIQLLSSPDLGEALVSEGRKQIEKFDTPQKRAYKYLTLCKQLAFEK